MTGVNVQLQLMTFFVSCLFVFFFVFFLYVPVFTMGQQMINRGGRDGQRNQKMGGNTTSNNKFKGKSNSTTQKHSLWVVANLKVEHLVGDHVEVG